MVIVNMVAIYYIFLVIAPQLWVKQLINFPVDLFLYPVWIFVLLARGNITKIVELKSYDLLFICMIIWLTISSLFNPINNLSNKIILDYIKFFIIFRLVVSSITSIGEMKITLILLISISYFLVVESIAHKFAVDGIGWAGQPLGWADEKIIQSTGSGRTKWVGIFDGPGVFCVIFTNILPFIVRYYDVSRSYFCKLFLTIGVLPVLLAIYFTGSRGGFLATIVIIFLYIIIREKIIKSRLIIGLIISILIISIAPSYLTSTSDSHSSAQKRIEMWKQGFEMTKYNPIFGIGKGNFGKYTGSMVAHNSAIEVMGETGLVGFFIWVTLIYTIIKGLYKSYANATLEEKSIIKSLIISLVGYIASSMFITLEYETFYFLLAISASFVKIKQIDIDLNKSDIILIIKIIFTWILSLKLLFAIY